MIDSIGDIAAIDDPVPDINDADLRRLDRTTPDNAAARRRLPPPIPTREEGQYPIERQVMASQQR
jgi:hypothetical protein